MRDHHGAAHDKTTPLTEEPLLSPQRAFVVQFRDGMDATPQRFNGRVEHLTTGRATRFYSSDELLAFLREVLTTVRTKPP